MAWIESHTGLLNHPKTKRLCRLLKIKRRDAVGLLHMLWWWAIDYVPEGDLSTASDDDVAEAVDWTREPSELVAALTLSGFLDESRRLHDWQDYAGRWIERRAANATRMRTARAERQRAGRAAHASSTLQPSVELPDLNLNRTLTGPNRTPTPTPPATEREGLSSLPLADASGDETGGDFELTNAPTVPVVAQAPTNGAGRVKPVLNGRNGWMGCPAGCPMTHGGPMAARHLRDDWMAIPSEQRLSWREFVASHGRPDLADVPAPMPAQAQEA